MREDSSNTSITWSLLFPTHRSPDAEYNIRSFPRTSNSSAVSSSATDIISSEANVIEECKVEEDATKSLRCWRESSSHEVKSRDKTEGNACTRKAASRASIVRTGSKRKYC
jgi:hypothetical protein